MKNKQSEYGSTKDKIEGYSIFRNYTHYDEDASIIASDLDKNSLDIEYSKSKCLINIRKIGKKFYEILAPTLKEYKEEKFDINEFSEFQNLGYVEIPKVHNEKDLLLISLKKLKDSKKLNEIANLTIKFCNSYGLPIQPEKENILGDELPMSQQGYPFNIDIFVSMSITIFLFFDTYKILNNIENYLLQNNTLGNNIYSQALKTKLKKLDSRDFSTLENYSFFFNFDMEKDSLQDLYDKYCIQFNWRNTNTPFLEYKNEIQLNNSSAYKRIVSIRYHLNMFSIAWCALLDNLMKKEYYEGTVENIKICEYCKTPFICYTKRQKYCDECQKGGKNLRVNSQKSYERKKQLHKILCEKYINNNKLSGLDEIQANEINKIVNTKKESEIKKIKMDKLEELIEFLDNL